MSVEVLDGAMILNFVEDEVAFNLLIEDQFASLNSNHDGLLLYAKMVRELLSLRVLKTYFNMDEVGLSLDELFQVYHGLFAWFDHDGNGTVELDEFHAKMREMMLAMSNGLRFLPVQMMVEEGSFLKRAVDKELAHKLTI